MKVECININGELLSDDYRIAGFTKQTIFDVNLSSEYVIYGVCIWRKLVLFLVVDETSKPNWYPAGLFKVVDTQFPSSWQFTRYNNKDERHVEAILGYPELLEKDHYIGLIEREEDALKIFYKRKFDID